MITLKEKEFEALRESVYLLQNFGSPEDAKVIRGLIKRAYAAKSQVAYNKMVKSMKVMK